MSRFEEFFRAGLRVIDTLVGVVVVGVVVVVVVVLARAFLAINHPLTVDCRDSAPFDLASRKNCVGTTG